MSESKRPLGGKAWTAARQLELFFRVDFEGGGVHQDPKTAKTLQARVSAIPGQIESLRSDYESTGNPTYVWEAISALGIYSRIFGQPFVPPSWVAAYLVRSAIDIVGSAAEWPTGDRRTPPTESIEAFRSKALHSGGMRARGLKPDQRRDILLETLGFKGTQGWQPLASYQRTRVRQQDQRDVDHAKAKGKKIRDVLPGLKDPHRAIRKVRQKHRAPGSK